MAVPVTLHTLNGTFSIHLEPAKLNWKTQNAGASFVVNYDSKIPEVGKLFIKRWERKEAYGHQLLLSAIDLPISGAPQVYGHFVFESDNYYVFEMLEQVKELEEFKKNVKLQENFFTRKFATKALSNLSQALQDINKRKHYYVDFSLRNIMSNALTPDAFTLIDIDSCVPHIMPANITEISKKFPFEQTWWALQAMRPAIRSHANPIVANQCMLMGFGLLWAHGIAAKHQKQSAWGYFDLDARSQSALFKLFESRNKKELIKQFCRSQSSEKFLDALINRWHDMISEFERNESVDWFDITKFVTIALNVADAVPEDIATHTQPKTILPPPRVSSTPKNTLTKDIDALVDYKSTSTLAHPPATFMINCFYCKTPQKASDVVCEHCSKPIRGFKECPHCKKQTFVGAKFCTQCGHAS